MEFHHWLQQLSFELLKYSDIFYLAHDTVTHVILRYIIHVSYSFISTNTVYWQLRAKHDYVQL